MIPTGILLECSSILIGGTAGALLRHRIPRRLQDPLMTAIGMGAIGLGIVSFIKIRTLPAVLLALILGCLIGESLRLGDRIKRGFSKVIDRLPFQMEEDREDYLSFYLVVSVIFCASGANILGILNEGITGDYSVLFSKAIMDLFSALVFAMRLGFPMHLIVLPQFVILMVLYHCSGAVGHLVSDTVMADFVATGGLITFCLGLNVAKIKEVNATNMLPAFLLIFPASHLLSGFL